MSEKPHDPETQSTSSKQLGAPTSKKALISRRARLAIEDKRQKISRASWGLLGFIALILGIIGIPLPILPTTPFLLLAAYCFARSSERLYHWLMEHPTFGEPIKAWQTYGAIPKKAKIAAGIAILAAFLGSYFYGVPNYALFAQGLILVCVAIFIFSRPSPPKP